MRTMIEIDYGKVPKGHIPVAFREPKVGEKYTSSGGKVKDCTHRQWLVQTLPRLIVEEVK